MRIAPISNKDGFNFKGVGSTVAETVKKGTNLIEKAAETLQVNTSAKRKTISIELHNSLVKLTAYRVFLLCAALFGYGGYKVGDVKNDNDAQSLINTLEVADIDTNSSFEVKDVNNDGNSEIVLQKKDGSKLILDLKNSNVLVESSGLKKVK